MYRIIIKSLIFVFLFIFQILAQGNLGQSGANFLQIAVEPRGAALGGAVTASVNGADALYWNPAGIVNVENFDLVLSHTDWFIDTKLAYGAIVKNFGDIGNIGFSVSSFYMDEMEITTVFSPDGSNEFYEAGDISLGISYARQLTEQFSFGATVKYVHEYILNETASQLAFDLGSVYRTNFYNLRIGMVIRNFSGTLKFSGDDIDERLREESISGISNNPRIERLTPDFRLPQVFQLGIAFDPLVMEDGTLTIVSDVDVPRDNQQRVILGAEYNYFDFVFLRGAYRMNYDEGKYSIGVGTKISLGDISPRLDYAYSEQGDLGDVHRFGFGVSF